MQVEMYHPRGTCLFGLSWDHTKWLCMIDLQEESECPTVSVGVHRDFFLYCPARHTGTSTHRGIQANHTGNVFISDMNETRLDTRDNVQHSTWKMPMRSVSYWFQVFNSRILPFDGLLQTWNPVVLELRYDTTEMHRGFHVKIFVIVARF